MQRTGVLVFVAAPLAIAIACGGSDNAAVDNTNGDGGAGDGSSAKDGRPPNPGDDASPTPTTYNDFTKASLWQFSDFSAVLGQGDAGLPVGYLGAIFDGKYMYYTPTGHNTTVGALSSNNYDMLRFDTTAPFEASTSYAAVDLKFLSSSLAYIGAAFDGRYIFPAPYSSTPFTRYDTKGAFDDLDASWNFGSASTIAHFGAVFTGQSVVYAPITTGVVQRFELADSGLTGFDTNAIDGGGATYQGVIFDGRYAYFAPSTNGGLGNTSHVLRLDTASDFNAASSWTTFDTLALDPHAQDFTGGVFDGRYVYFAPTTANVAITTDVRFVRFDTKADFSNPASWQFFAPTPDAQSIGYHTAGFDGRYVYFLPFVATGPFNLVRYDTTASFDDGGAWSSIDTTTLNPGATGYEGVGFDGRWIYLVPRYGRIAARFDAKSPPSIPPGFGGSFL